ncbi:Cell division protein FtsL [BD1-7 clade bacterium]|uniref:Cell division protein FtsL n=1 Tax=BD1-7 clade bacterium TaxID=2029982 RepID=A0A5S9N3I0_9GAMM|nr:Cell division protein FtsL [BD1-7 clade bacterium]
MTSWKLSLLLWPAVILSALAVVFTTHASRQNFIAWQNLIKQGQEFEVEWGQLLIERSTLASYTRLEQIAAEKLDMAVPTAKQIVVVAQGSQP